MYVIIFTFTSNHLLETNHISHGTLVISAEMETDRERASRCFLVMFWKSFLKMRRQKFISRFGWDH